jgi:hypothetical protein
MQRNKDIREYKKKEIIFRQKKIHKNIKSQLKRFLFVLYLLLADFLLLLL